MYEKHLGVYTYFMLHSDENEEDLIGSIMNEADSEPSSYREVEDVVGAIYSMASVHERFCSEFVPYVNPAGIVYCHNCGGTVGSVIDNSDCFCPKCACPNSAHLNGRCLMLVDGKPCPCSDGHEFTESNWTRQQQEAKAWLRKKEAAKAKRQSAETPTP